MNDSKNHGNLLTSLFVPLNQAAVAFGLTAACSAFAMNRSPGIRSPRHLGQLRALLGPAPVRDLGGTQHISWRYAKVNLSLRVAKSPL